MKHLAITEFDSFMQRLDIWLDQKGWRRTNQRVTITGLVFVIDSPFTTDQLIAMSRALPDGRCVSTATIYRSVRELEDAGMIAPTKNGDETECRLI